MRTLFRTALVLGLLASPALAGEKKEAAPAKTDAAKTEKAPADAKKPTDAKADAKTEKAPVDAKKPADAKTDAKSDAKGAKAPADAKAPAEAKAPATK